MRFTRKLLVLMMAFSVLLLPVAVGQDQAKADDSTAIKQFVDGFISDFNHHDAHAMSIRFIEDGDYVNGGGNLSHGQKEIEEHFVTLFGGPLASASRENVVVKNMRVLSPVIASVDISYELTNMKARDGSSVPARDGLYASVLIKQNGHWLIAVLHEIGIGPRK